jgi:hypothetical protein
VIPLGTLEVRKYLATTSSETLPPRWATSNARWPTHGPGLRYGAALFVEKEGFGPLFQAARLAERWDIAIFSTKGLSTTAARTLVDHLVQGGVPVYCIRDFDEAGFKIAGTLRRDTRRYQFATAGAIDLGLRLEDVRAWSLDSEQVYYHSDSKRVLKDHEAIRAKIGPGLLANGAMEDEIAFLLTHRVELNAFSSDRLIAWIEAKLAAAGVRKVVPDDAMLARAACDYAREMIEDRVLRGCRQRVAAEAAGFAAMSYGAAITAMLAEDGELAWDDALHLLIEKKLAS